ncbi:class I SAM-dependent methyltransferase [Pimelobacter simplex]|uniref:class I SAM-dependent methyltransferase n=1 Tax=Nocardioides simplex TaxID=2045 RepID=UPI003AAB42AA
MPWPKRLRAFLVGWSDVRVVADERTLFTGRVAFTDDDAAVDMRDRHGLPVIVDKWGLLQRPFDTRGEGLLGLLADESQRIIDVLEDTCGVRSWISFGTLLGAARSGKAIGHDSDVDLCYLSEKSTPAEMQRELWDIARALRAASMKLQIRAGCFLTVQVPTPDGAGAGIDVYTTFFFDGNLYETATVRTPVPREALLPLKPIEFEGRMLPGPADPATILEISYGPNWKVPDPSFQHQPGPEIEQRFDGWFGKLWRQRREWNAFNRTAAKAGPVESGFARDVLPRLPEGVRVLDVGAGTGADAAYFARHGVPAVALDYALPRRRLWPDVEGLARNEVNLYDVRDVLTRAVLLARHRGPQAVYARGLLESLAPDGREQFWQLVAVALRGGGEIHLESQAWSRPALAERTEALGGRFWPTGPAETRRAAEAIGAEVRAEDGVRAAEAALAATTSVPPATWRMTIHVPPRGGSSA